MKESLKQLYDKYKSLLDLHSYEDYTSGNILPTEKRAITRAYNRFHDRALKDGYNMTSNIPDFMKPSNS